MSWTGGVCLSREIEKCVHGICLLLQNTGNIYYPNLRTITTPKFCSCTWGQQQHDNASIDYYAFPLLTTIISKNIIGFHPINSLLTLNHFITMNGKLLFFCLRPIVGKDVATKICRMYVDSGKQTTTKREWDRKEYQFTLYHISGEVQCNCNNEVLVCILECKEKLNKIIENL
jgi:hypothetical protein